MTDPKIIPPADKQKRQSEFSEELFEEICQRMEGGEWLRKICDKDAEIPSRQTFLRWIEKDTGRQERYARASRAMVDYWAEELLEIANETDKDTITDEKGRRRCNFEWVANKKLHSENLRFLMSKIYPKRYGDRAPELVMMQDHAAEAKAAPVLEVRWEREIISPIHDDDGTIIGAHDNAKLRARIRQLEERLGIQENGEPLPPKQITYDPGPLPSRTEGQILYSIAQAIKNNVPKADQRSPEEVISEVMAEFERVLQAKYGSTADAA